MKYKTVREGQQALVRNHLGEGRLVVGPRRVFLFRERLEFLRHFSAIQTQYLVVKDSEGTVEHRPGPCELFFNPLEHERVEVRDMITLDANEALVVYKQEKGVIERRIVHGPVLFAPTANEWLHEFKWHGEDPKNKARIIPQAKVFTKLHIVPQQFYYNVPEVRTNDDVTIKVKLMLFYELRDMETMLNATHDPIADFINAVCSDVITFTATMSYEEFIKRTHKLSELETYSQLVQRSGRIGFDITKVVYRGYHASDALQQMHDKAIQSRTTLRLNTELEETRQRMTEVRLRREVARGEKQREKENAVSQHKHIMEKEKAQAELEQSEIRHGAKLEDEASWRVAKLEAEEKEKEIELSYLQQLGKCGVDLTRYLTNQRSAGIVHEELQVY